MDSRISVCQVQRVTAKQRKPIKVRKDFRINPALVVKTVEMAKRLDVTETSIVEKALEKFHTDKETTNV